MFIEAVGERTLREPHLTPHTVKFARASTRAKLTRGPGHRLRVLASYHRCEVVRDLRVTQAQAQALSKLALGVATAAHRPHDALTYTRSLRSKGALNDRAQLLRSPDKHQQKKPKS
jgi:hypothetical protein